MNAFTELDPKVRTNLSRLDIVVPTYERQEYALRLMRYWSGTGARVFVLDGSKNAIATHSLVDLGDDIVYLHRPVSYQERLLEATRLVSREFQMMMADDELYLPSAVSGAITHLDAYPKHWGATGKVALFYCDSNGVIGEEWYTGYGNYPPLALTSSQKDRARSYEVPHYAMLGVIRSSYWRDLWELIFRHRYTCPYAYEAMFHMSAPYIGVTWVIDELLWLRSVETDENVSDSWDRRMTLHDWFDDPNFGKERLLWEESVAGIVRRFAETPLPEVDVRETAQFIIGRQIAGSRPKTYTWTRKQRIHRAIRSLTPQAVRDVMKVLLPRRVLRAMGYSSRPLLDVAREMMSRGTRVDLDQLSATMDVVRDFHRNRNR